MRSLPASIVTVAIASTLVWGCAVAPSPSPSPTGSGPPEPPSTAGSDGTAAAIPSLLLFRASGPDQGLWRIDPDSPGRAPSRVGAPDGPWRPTAPATGGLVALTSLDDAPPRVALARLAGTALTPLWTTTLPAGELWSGGRAECVSSTGSVAVGDAGATIHTLDARGELGLVPGQRNNLGACTWLDPTTVLWDQEDPEMRAWTVGATESTAVPIRRFEPTSGGGRLAWFDDSTGTLRVATFQVSAGQVLVGPTTGGLTFPPGEQPAGLALSVDGEWLVALVDDQIAIYPVSDAGLARPTRIPLAEVGYTTGDVLTWMPMAP